MKQFISGLFSSALLFLCSLNLQARQTDAQLTAQILHLDSLFWQSYNTCDTTSMRQYFTEDLQFYHDKGGPSFGYQTMVNTFQKNLCNGSFKLRREAVPGTVVVYPMRSNDTLYGALISGEHYFYVTEKGQKEKRSGLAKFSQLWLKKDGVWKMSLVLSYDHGPAPIAYKPSIKLPAAALKKYTGVYQGPQTTGLIIREENGALVMLNNNKKTTLYASSSNQFFMKERAVEFVFSGNKLTVMENGQIAEELVLQKK